jgi:hypothetical protein
MSRSWIAFLALVLALPAFAQDDAEVVPVEEGAEAPAEEAPAEEAPAEAAPAEEAAAEEAPAEPAEPWAIYVGADYVTTTLSASAPVSAPATDADSRMVRVRAGKKLFEGIGFELQVGIDQADDDSGEVPLDSYYGAYLVPNATLLDVVELAFPVGYGRSTFDEGDALGSVAYGIDAELPLRVFGESLPDFRLTAGWMVYYQKSDARVYGANVGLRYDFQVDGFGNPFAGLANLWPFGGDEEAAPAE